jgi:hypothetical protein
METATVMKPQETFRMLVRLYMVLHGRIQRMDALTETGTVGQMFRTVIQTNKPNGPTLTVMDMETTLVENLQMHV